MDGLKRQLDQLDQVLTTRVREALPRDVEGLESMVVQHKDFEEQLQGLEGDYEAAQRDCDGPQCTPDLEVKMADVTDKWEDLWNMSHLYVER